MQYNVLDMPGRSVRSNITYQRQGRTVAEYASLHSQATVLQEEQDGDGETIYRRVPQATYPQPDSHYVMFRADNEDVWRIYAGPFDLETAAEIASALSIYSN